LKIHPFDMSAKDAVCILENLAAEGYIFRGHSSTKYELVPLALRDKSLKEFAKNFKISEKTIKEKWYTNSDLVNAITSGLCGAKWDAGLKKRCAPMLDLYIHIARINYNLNMNILDKCSILLKSCNDIVIDELKKLSEKNNNLPILINTFENKIKFWGKKIDSEWELFDLNIEQETVKKIPFADAELTKHQAADLPEAVRETIRKLHGHMDLYLMVFEEEKEILKLRDPDFWTKEESFVAHVKYIFPHLIERYFMDGTVQYANPFEELVGVDFRLPQHYGIETSALDWTYDPYIAIYFALRKDERFDSIQISKKPMTPFFSIFAYKKTNVECPLVLVQEKSQTLFNPRAEAQKGVFTYFAKPCSFYLKHPQHRFPSILDYNKSTQSGFQLERLNIERSMPNLKFLQDQLKAKNINEATLLLND